MSNLFILTSHLFGIGIPKRISVPRPFSENWTSKTETRCGSSTSCLVLRLLDWRRRAIQKQVFVSWNFSFNGIKMTYMFLLASSPLRKLLDGRRTLDKNRWINSPNVYQKVEIVEQGSQDPKKITKVVWSSQLHQILTKWMANKQKKNIVLLALTETHTTHALTFRSLGFLPSFDNRSFDSLASVESQ